MLCAAVWADRADEMVRALGSEDPGARSAARRWLAAQGEQVTPALERGLESLDAEVRASVVALLRAFGRVDMPDIPELTGLRAADPNRRSSAARAIVRKYGPELLQEIYQSPAPKLRVVPGQTAFEAGEWADASIRIRNVGKHAGWCGRPLSARLSGKKLKGFGRPVRFPFNQLIGIGGGFGCGRRRYDARHFEWLEPNQNAVWHSARIHVPSGPLGRLRGTLSVSLTTWMNAYGPKIKVETPSSVSCTFEYFAVPGRQLRGATREKTRLSVSRKGNDAVLRLTCEDGRSLAPRDFSSTWILVRDGKGRVVHYGPADGKDREARSYKRDELAEARSLEARFPLPRKNRVAVVFGTRFTRGTAQGHVVVSNRLLLLNAGPAPVTSKGP